MGIDGILDQRFLLARRQRADDDIRLLPAAKKRLVSVKNCLCTWQYFREQMHIIRFSTFGDLFRLATSSGHFPQTRSRREHDEITVSPTCAEHARRFPGTGNLANCRSGASSPRNFFQLTIRPEADPFAIR